MNIISNVFRSLIAMKDCLLFSLLYNSGIIIFHWKYKDLFEFSIRNHKTKKLVYFNKQW